MLSCTCLQYEERSTRFRALIVLSKVIFLVVFISFIFGMKALDNVVVYKVAEDCEGTILTKSCIFLVSFVIVIQSLAILQNILHLCFVNYKKE